MSVAEQRVEALPEPAENAPGQAVGPAAPSAPAEAEPATPRFRINRRVPMLAVPLVLAVAGGWFWLTGGRYVTTDNAYVHQPMVSVSPEVAGRIVEVNVIENQRVEAGAPVFRVDPEPYQIALDQADAALAGARLSVDQLRSAYATAGARMSAAEEIRDIRKRELDRQQSLAGTGIASSSKLDEATLAWRAAENDVTLAHEGVSAALAALGGNPDIATDDVPVVRAALAQRASAARNLDKAVGLAPVTGIVGQVASLNVGQYVTPGTAVASLVRTDDTWIEANFKETQIGALTPGQPVDIEIDAYPGVKLHGVVESIGSATGSQYALIPAQNATGNWVKVVQRLAVRVGIDTDPDHPLRDGMSANVSVDTGRSRLDDLL